MNKPKNDKSASSNFSGCIVLLIFSFIGFLFLANIVFVIKFRTDGQTERAIRLREFPANIDISGRRPGTDRLFRLRTTADHFIYPAGIHAQPDKKIFFLGGSTTECFYVDEKKRFPYLAIELLEERTGKKINSYNAAVSSSNSLHSINILFNKVMPYEPDVSVMMHNINDLIILMYTGTYWNDHFNRSALIVMNNDNADSIFKLIFPGLAELATRIRQKMGKAEKKDEWAKYRNRKVIIDEDYFTTQFSANIDTYIGMCRARGIVPVLMTQPNRFKKDMEDENFEIVKTLDRDFGIKYEEFLALYYRFNDIIRNKSREKDVIVIDLANRVPQSDEYMYDWVHLNNKGSVLVSDIIASDLAGKLQW